MTIAIACWLLIQNGFGQPNGGIVLGRFYSQAECLKAAAEERMARELPTRYTNDCVPMTVAW